MLLSIVVMWQHIDKEVNKELPEDDLIEDQNMLVLPKVFLSDFNIT